MKVKGIYELRGIEKRETEEEKFFKFNLEDENGNPIELYTREEKFLENKQKGKKYEIELDYNFKFKKFKFLGIQEVK